MICELSYRLDQFEKHTSGRKFVFFDKVLLLFHDMGLFLEFVATICLVFWSEVLSSSSYIIRSLPLGNGKGSAKKQDMRHPEIFRSKQVLQVSTSQRRAIQLRVCIVLDCVAFFPECRCSRRCSHAWCCGRPWSGSQWCRRMRGQHSHGILCSPWRCQWRCQGPSWRPWSSPWWSHCNGSMRPRSKAPQDAASIRRWSSVEGVVSWFWRVLLPQHRATLTRQGMSKLRKHQSMILVDLRGQDRASGAIPAVPGIAPLARSCPNPGHGSPQENREICGGVWGPAGCGIVFASIQLTEPSPMRWILAECHDRLVPKLLHIFLANLQG